MKRKPDDLEAEAAHATELLAGKTVKVVRRTNERVVLVEFSDGTRLFVDSKTAVELSIIGTNEPE